MTGELETPIDRHDLEALKDWIEAKFETVGATLHGMDEAIKLAAEEREKKDAELNDVRLRFVPRETFDAAQEASLARIGNLERNSASTEAVNSYKRIVYGVAATALVAFLVAVFNLATKAGG